MMGQPQLKLPRPQSFLDSLHGLQRDNTVQDEPTLLAELRYPSNIDELRLLMAVAQRSGCDLALRHLGMFCRIANTTQTVVPAAVHIKLRMYDLRRPELAVTQDWEQVRECARARAQDTATDAATMETLADAPAEPRSLAPVFVINSLHAVIDWLRNNVLQLPGT